uniref:Uncharacterized protein n=1 Tax=Anguilla anguilla TaxID=7936 RepID=A0A0E9WM37_ANGAN
MVNEVGLHWYLYGTVSVKMAADGNDVGDLRGDSLLSGPIRNPLAQFSEGNSRL